MGQLEIGDIATGRKIDKDSGNKYIWVVCPNCKRERWVRLRKGNPVSIRCNNCALQRRKGINSPSWKGGKRKRPDGYINVWVDITSPFFEMRNRKNYILEHRLVMAQHLGRCIKSWELVHHKNHIRDDNRLENLQLLKMSDHQAMTLLETENERLREKNEELRREIMSSQEQDKIEDLEDENKTLREVRDELMDENERLRMGEVLELRKEVRRLREEIKSREENQKLENKKKEVN